MPKIKDTAPAVSRSGIASAAEAIARSAADAAINQAPIGAQIGETVAAAAEPAAKAGSPKKKSERGCPEDWKTTWVTFNNPPEVHSMLLKVAKKRGTNVDPMLSSLLKTWLDENKKSLEAEAAEWDAGHPAKGPREKPMGQMTEAELGEFMAKLQKQMADLEVLAAAKRAEVAADAPTS